MGAHLRGEAHRVGMDEQEEASVASTVASTGENPVPHDAEPAEAAPTTDEPNAKEAEEAEEDEEEDEEEEEEDDSNAADRGMPMKKKELQEAVVQLLGIEKSVLAGLDREQLEQKLKDSPGWAAAESGMNRAIEKLKPRLQPLLAFSGSTFRRKQLFDIFDAILVPNEPGVSDPDSVAKQQVMKLVEEMAEKNVQAANKTAEKVGKEADRLAEMVKARAHSWTTNGDAARARARPVGHT